MIREGLLFSQIGSFNQEDRQKDWKGEKLCWRNKSANIMKFTVSMSNIWLIVVEKRVSFWCNNSFANTVQKQPLPLLRIWILRESVGDLQAWSTWSLICLSYRLIHEEGEIQVSYSQRFRGCCGSLLLAWAVLFFSLLSEWTCLARDTRVS